MTKMPQVAKTTQSGSAAARLHKYRQTDRQTANAHTTHEKTRTTHTEETERQPDRQTYRQTEKQTEARHR